MAEQGETYGKFVEVELKNERDRRSSLDQRGLGVVTSSAAFVTLVFSLSVVLTGRDFRPTAGAAGLLIASLTSLVFAGIVGISASSSREYQVAAPETIREMLDGHWVDDEVDARNVAATLNLRTLETLRDGNNAKAWLLIKALVLQVIGMALLSGAIVAQTIGG